MKNKLTALREHVAKTSMKKCTRCKVTRAINSFYTDKRTPDGHATICRSCISTRRKVKRGNRSTGEFSTFTVEYCPCEIENGCSSYLKCGIKQLACSAFGGWVNDGKLNKLSKIPTRAEFRRLFPNDRPQSNS